MEPIGFMNILTRLFPSRITHEICLDIYALRQFCEGSCQLSEFHKSLPSGALPVFQEIREGTINDYDRDNILRFYQNRYEITRDSLLKAFIQALKKQPKTGNTAFELNCRNLIANFDDLEIFQEELKKCYETEKSKGWETMGADDFLPFMIDVIVHAQDPKILLKVAHKLIRYEFGFESYLLLTMQIAIHKIME